MPPKAGAETAVNNQDPARKKRKASRACQSCQRAHLTCSDTRPCARCTKRGEECIEGEKKKARYLYTQEELESLPKPAPKARRSSSSASNAVRLSPQQKASSSNVKLELSTTNAVQAGPAHPQGNVNGSSAPGARATSSLDGQDLWPAPPSSANGNSNGHVESLRTAFNPGSLVATHPQSAQPRMANNNYFASISPSSDSLSSTSLSFQQQQQILQSASQSFVDSYPPSKMSSNAVGSALPTSSTNLPSSINQLGLWPELPDVAHSHVSSSTNASFVDPPFFPSPGVDLRASHTSPPAAFPSHHQQTSERQLPLPILKESLKGKGRELAPLSDLQAEGGRGGYWDQGLEKGLRGAASGSNDAYALATRHGRAYRRLLSHVKDKYGEADALKVVKSISEFRPKVLSTTSHHTQEDTLFLEFALHRALKDLTNTLLPITGTPTAIWRRTGEILAVGAEFCILTEWNQADVVFRDTEDIPLGERGTGSGKDGSEGWKGCFCWELMEKQSVIEFYDNFSRCAFDGTTPSFNLLCTLLTPSGRAISCTACFSIRRDVFDFPSLIVAQFLPLLL